MSQNSTPLLILGLNPAWQKLFILDKLVPGAVHRLAPGREFASGKGINMGRVLAKLGCPSHLVQFAGGYTGERLLAEINSAKIAHTTVVTKAATRICTTLSDHTGESTELIEPSPELVAGEVDSLFQKMLPLWTAASRVALCGTAPTGFDWTRLGLLKREKRFLYLDAWTGIDPWLVQGVRLLKVNAEELARLLGVASGGGVVDLFALAKVALERFPIETLVVTQGSRRVLVFRKERVLSLNPPKARNFVNAIGAGDSFLAGWIAADSVGLSVEGCLARAVAVSSVRCEAELPWELDLERVHVVERQSLERIGELPWNY